MSHACPYCISGRIYVEAGSSLSYRCTDCEGTSVIEDHEPDLDCDDDRDDDDGCPEPQSVNSPS
jgi:hypothetical protein